MRTVAELNNRIALLESRQPNKENHKIVRKLQRQVRRLEAKESK